MSKRIQCNDTIEKLTKTYLVHSYVRSMSNKLKHKPSYQDYRADYWAEHTSNDICPVVVTNDYRDPAFNLI